MEQIESEADHAIAKARALMTGLSPRPDDLHNAAIVVVEDDDDMFETVELDKRDARSCYDLGCGPSSG